MSRSRRPLNPYAQPYFAHNFHNHGFLCEDPTRAYAQNHHSMQNPDHFSHMESTAADQNPRVVVHRRERNRNVGPRLRSQTSLADNFVGGRSTTSTDCVWKPKDKASNFASTSNWGGAVIPSSSMPDQQNSRGRMNNMGPRLSLGTGGGGRKLGRAKRHGVQTSNFADGKGSVIPFPRSPDQQNGSEITTLMIKNIPCQLR